MTGVIPLTRTPGHVLATLAALDPRPPHGRIVAALGPVLHALLPGAAVGELAQIRSQMANSLPAEVIGVQDNIAILAPIGEIKGVATGCSVFRTRRALQVPVGDRLLGRSLDGLGRPLDQDSRGPLPEGNSRGCETPPMDALKRDIMTQTFSVGVRVLDGLLTCGEGQRLGIYGEPGTGKSVLIGQLVRGATADVVVVGLIGERGREAREFVERHLPSTHRARTVLVVATSDRPALERMRAAHTATTIAEEFRDRGLRVLLVIDSVTRFARAMREIGLAAGEPPTRRGFPPSVMAQLPQLLERPGLGRQNISGRKPGSITAFYTVLVEGDGEDDPIAEETRSLLDGHIVLSPKLAAAGHFPAIDVLRSRSRVMDSLVSTTHRAAAEKVRALLDRHRDTEFLVQVGEYRPGADPFTDEAMASIDKIREFLRQDTSTRYDPQETVAWLDRLTA